MESKDTLLQVCQDYLTIYPTEKDRQAPFIQYLERTKSSALYIRKNFDGHITASVFVINKDLSKVLLIHHNTLDRWLQPGGHVEETTDENIYAAALRECLEETGISEGSLRVIHPSNSSSVPFDIDSHRIPHNDKKNEAAHYHHDFRYLLVCDNVSTVTINEDESKGYRWCDLSDLAKDEEFELVVGKMRAALVIL